MVTTFSEKTYYDDIVRFVQDEHYSIAEVTVYNRTGSTISVSSVMGHPLRPDSSVSGAYRLCMGTEEAYCNGILIENRSFVVTTWATATSIKSKALIRGMATIDKSMLPTTDAAGASFTLATLVTALLALSPPVLANAELSPTVTQSR